MSRATSGLPRRARGGAARRDRPPARDSAHANLGTAALAENRLGGRPGGVRLGRARVPRAAGGSSLLPVLANRAQIHHQQGDFAAAAFHYGDAAASAATLGLASAVKQWGEPGVQAGLQVGDVARAESLWQLADLGVPQPG